MLSHRWFSAQGSCLHHRFLLIEKCSTRFLLLFMKCAKEFVPCSTKQGFWYFVRLRSGEIQVNPRYPVKFTKTRKIPGNLVKCMSVQQFWNLSQLLGVFTLCKLANLCLKTSSLKRANNVPKLQGVDYVAKNWALAMTLKALPLVHFWSVLLLKEQMMTSVRKTLKMLVWSAQNRSISSEICPENNQIRRFLPIVCPENSCEIPTKSADFSVILSLKVLWNLTFFHDLSEALTK